VRTGGSCSKFLQKTNCRCDMMFIKLRNLQMAVPTPGKRRVYSQQKDDDALVSLHKVRIAILDFNL